MDKAEGKWDIQGLNMKIYIIILFWDFDLGWC